MNFPRYFLSESYVRHYTIVFLSTLILLADSLKVNFVYIPFFIHSICIDFQRLVKALRKTYVYQQCGNFGRYFLPKRNNEIIGLYDQMSAYINEGILYINHENQSISEEIFRQIYNAKKIFPPLDILCTRISTKSLQRG